MRSSATIADLARVGDGRFVGSGDVAVTDVQHDSRALAAGHLFVAVRGLTVDGHLFVEAAERAGAAAVCVETESTTVTIPQLIVDDTRHALGPLAAAVHHHPSRDISVVGVTGTNGKTTVTHFLESIVAAAGMGSGLIGTLGARINGTSLPIARTTPEASDFQRILRLMADAGVAVAAAEVSSHALTLHRVDGTEFRVAAFTNLSQDHLDFHADMEDYFAAKASLFELGDPPSIVVWRESEWGRRLIADHLTGRRVTTVGLTSAADVHGRGTRHGLDGSLFELVTPTAGSPVALSMPGDFNVENALVAAACAHELGIGMEAIVSGLESITSVPGRFERISGDGGADRQVIVDYAHTPAGVEAVISAARRIAPGRLIVVVGAAGDRDRDKRPMMGRAAAAADVVIVTSDNPRSEAPETLTSAVVAGATAAGHGDITEIVDRRQAIGTAIERAGRDDLVLVLGRGAETHQEVAGEFIPFDDRDVVRAELGQR